jgi:AmiR/NasT family two-component response regulator
MKPPRILFADGKQHVRDHFLSLFHAMHYQTVAAQDGRQLGELCRTFRPDVLVTDEHLPDGSGLAAAAAAAREHLTAIIVLAAAVGSDLLRQLDQEPLVLGCLVKPVNPSELEAAVRIAARRGRELRAEALRAPPSSDEEALLRRAERAVMRWAGVDAEAAQCRLRELAAARGLSLAGLAHTVLNAEEAFTVGAKPAGEEVAAHLSVTPAQHLRHPARHRTGREPHHHGEAGPAVEGQPSAEEAAGAY